MALYNLPWGLTPISSLEVNEPAALVGGVGTPTSAPLIGGGFVAILVRRGAACGTSSAER